MNHITTLERMNIERNKKNGGTILRTKEEKRTDVRKYFSSFSYLIMNVLYIIISLDYK